jgi:hypothetical protein
VQHLRGRDRDLRSRCGILRSTARKAVRLGNSISEHACSAREEVCRGLTACLAIVLVWPTQCTSEPVRNIEARMIWC